MACHCRSFADDILTLSITKYFKIEYQVLNWSLQNIQVKNTFVERQSP